MYVHECVKDPKIKDNSSQEYGILFPDFELVFVYVQLFVISNSLLQLTLLAPGVTYASIGIPDERDTNITWYCRLTFPACDWVKI